jgi:hypothetical protein
MAQIGWIDFSPTHRQRVGSVLDLLRPEGMVDELGLGTIRDALANQLFPGISTIQTRAKYFFIIPYILYEYQVLKPAQRRGKTPVQYLEQREYEIMWQLAEHYQEGNGVIGISKRKPQKIVRRPSAIYWTGLYTYRFMDTRGLSADAFLRQCANPSIESLLVSIQQGDDSSGDDADAEHENMFHIKVPPKLSWDNNLTLDLEKEEAEFFLDRIISIAKDRVIAELLNNNALWQIFVDAEDFMHFAKAAAQPHLADNLSAMLTLAHDFSELLYGAHIAYNCLLQQATFSNNYYEEDWDNWLKDLPQNMLHYSGFNPEDLFQYALTTKGYTEQFVKDWWVLVNQQRGDMAKRDSLIQRQEAQVKGHKARIRWNKLDDVKEEQWIGLSYLDYRFGNVKTILNDIKTGLNT